jgi:hypothetical protein
MGALYSNHTDNLEAVMRKLVNILAILAAICFGFGTLAALFSSRLLPAMTGSIMPAFSPETYWRGAVALLLFSMTLLMMHRTPPEE